MTEKVQVRPDWAKLPAGDAGIDIECVKLCEAMNKFPGINTIESCCGHGESFFRIWFVADNLESLPPILYFFDGCHTFYGWSVIASTDCSMSPVIFRAEGPIGEIAYEQANKIAEIAENYLAADE